MKFWPFALVLLLFICIVGHWSAILPYNEGPDEILHFHSNVEFILDHHRLPVSGVDDMDIYRQCFDSTTGRQTCKNSYNMFPALDYLIAAITAALGRSAGLSSLAGARIASLAWGIVFVVALQFMFLEILESFTFAAVFSALIALIPQLMFTCAYVNADAHSLAISALLGLSATRLYKRQDKRRIVEFAAATGLLFSAKYNYFIYVPFIPLFVGWLFLQKKLDRKSASLTLGACAVMSLGISGFWFLRNAYLYHDPLGLKFAFAMMDRFHAPGVSRPLDWAGAWFLHEHQFYWHTLLSFVGDFKNRTLHFPAGVYLGYYCVFAAGVGGLGYVIIRHGDRTTRAGAFTAAALVGICFLQHMYNSLTVDLQPQGRYLFPDPCPARCFSRGDSAKISQEGASFRHSPSRQ